MIPLLPLAALAIGVPITLTALHPDPEALAQAEMPPKQAQVLKPLLRPVLKPVTTQLSDPHRCPAPDRGFNPLYVSAAREHARWRSRQAACDVHSLAEVESNQRADAVSPAGARGLVQFMPPTARDLGIDPLVPAEAVDGAARYLSWLWDRFPHVAPEDRPKFVLAAYNRGVGFVRRTGCTTWACLEPLLPEETRTYVPRNLAMRATGDWYRVLRR